VTAGVSTARAVDGVEPRLTQPDDADRVAGFILAWLAERDFGIDVPSRRVMAGRVAAAARARPGSQLYWKIGDDLAATCSIQPRMTSSGPQALLQLRIGAHAWERHAASAIVEHAFAAGRELVPTGSVALVLPRGDLLEADLSHRGFAETMALLTLTRPAELGVPAVDPPDHIAIRPLRPGLDEDRYVAVQREAFHDDPFGSGITADDIRHQLELGVVAPDDFFLAESDGQLVGVARALFDAEGRNPDGGPFAEIVGNGVLPEFRRHGIGQALVRAQIQHLHDRGASTICLTVISLRPELIEHYRHAGFAESGRQTIWVGLADAERTLPGPQ
jgi:ribosomal protein S18 acetylase RimI-like enzyme